MDENDCECSDTICASGGDLSRIEYETVRAGRTIVPQPGVVDSWSSIRSLPHNGWSA